MYSTKDFKKTDFQKTGFQQPIKQDRITVHWQASKQIQQPSTMKNKSHDNNNNQLLVIGHSGSTIVSQAK